MNIRVQTNQLDDIPGRLLGYGTFSVIRELHGGHRNQAFLVRDLEGAVFVAKTTTRSEAALAWAADLQAEASRCGIIVPRYIQAVDGSYAPAGLTLEPMYFGREALESELSLVRPALTKLRAATKGWSQRPGFVSASDILAGKSGGDANLSILPKKVAQACRAAWKPLKGRAETVLHGDINISNVLIDVNGQVILLDWDEARCDSPLFDQASFHPNNPALQHIRLAWEVVCCWMREPEHAKFLADRLLTVHQMSKRP